MSSTVNGALIMAFLITVAGVFKAGNDLPKRVFWLQAECFVLVCLWVFHG